MGKQVLKKGLIVSCQALEDEPLFGYSVMGRMAYAAVMGGAVGIRANGARDILEIRAEVKVPIIGLIKKVYEDSEIYITPTKAELDVLANLPCEVIALDATMRVRPNGETLESLVEYMRKTYPDKELMADIATLKEAQNADRLGFDYISSTLNGYTSETKNNKIPDMGLIKKMLKEVKNAKVVAEGGIWTADELKKVVKAGVETVVVGTAITRPQCITKRFADVFKIL